MSGEFRLEDPGEGIHEAEIVEVNVSVGDEVADGDTLMTVETDKAAVELPSPFSGVVEKIHVSAGDVAEVGDTLITYTDGGGAERSADRGAEEPAGEPEAKKDGEAEEEETAAEAEPGEEAEAKGETEKRADEDRRRPVPASPATRRLARELDVDLRQVEPSGPHGRVTAEDVKGQAEAPERGRARPEEGKAPRREAGRARAEGVELPDFAHWGEVERQPLRSIRRATAKKMARAWAEIPHVMHHDVADITALERYRQEHKATAEECGGRLTLTVLVMKALVAALKAHPRFNASLDAANDEIVVKRYFNVGLAIDTEQGLLVPVVRDADRKSIVELSVELVELSEKARAGELAPEEMQGGSITITNPGPLGGRLFTPIINHPEVAILGLAESRLEAQVQGSLDDFELVPKLVLPFCLAFDHRVNDGADAARFCGTLARLLGDADAVLLNS